VHDLATKVESHSGARLDADQSSLVFAIETGAAASETFISDRSSTSARCFGGMALERKDVVPREGLALLMAVEGKPLV
jgi:hypothetical protein